MLSFYQRVKKSRTVLNMVFRLLTRLAWKSQKKAKRLVPMEAIEEKVDSKTCVPSVESSYLQKEEDEEAVAAGQLGVSYGADEVKVNHVQTIVWYEEGISYMLQEINYVIDKAQLIERAQAIMNK